MNEKVSAEESSQVLVRSFNAALALKVVRTTVNLGSFRLLHHSRQCGVTELLPIIALQDAQWALCAYAVCHHTTHDFSRLDFDWRSHHKWAEAAYNTTGVFLACVRG